MFDVATLTDVVIGVGFDVEVYVIKTLFTFKKETLDISKLYNIFELFAEYKLGIKPKISTF
jgi:hypothetical protein